MIHDRFVAALTERMKSLVIGDALDPATHIGPVVDDSQLRQNLSYVGIGVADGAKLALGGERVASAKPGCYMRPALFTEADNSHADCSRGDFRASGLRAAREVV